MTTHTTSISTSSDFPQGEPVAATVSPPIPHAVAATPISELEQLVSTLEAGWAADRASSAATHRLPESMNSTRFLVSSRTSNTAAAPASCGAVAFSSVDTGAAGFDCSDLPSFLDRRNSRTFLADASSVIAPSDSSKSISTFSE